MAWLRAACRELFALFVDDVPFSLAVLVWLGIGATALPRAPVATAWDAPLLFVGCLVILVESVLRSALRHRRRTRTSLDPGSDGRML